MTDGVHQSFGVASALLLVAGILSVFFLNPDRTGRLLQSKYATDAADEGPVPASK